MRNELNEKFDYPFSHVFIFGNMFPIRLTVSLICRSQAVSKILVQLLTPIKLVKGEETVRTCDRHSYESVTLRNMLLI